MGEGRGPDPLAELMDCREMGNFLEMDLLPERIHNFSQLYRVPIIFGEILFQEKKNE